MKKLLTALALLTLIPTAANAETYHTRLDVAEQKFKLVTVKPYARCTQKQIAKLPALSAESANVESSSVCLGKSGCTLTLRIPEQLEADVQYYQLEGKACTIKTADKSSAKDLTGYSTDVEIPTRLIAKGVSIPKESDHGKISDIRSERIFTTVKITYIDKPTVDVIEIGKNLVKIYY